MLAEKHFAEKHFEPISQNGRPHVQYMQVSWNRGLYPKNHPPFMETPIWILPQADLAKQHRNPQNPASSVCRVSSSSKRSNAVPVSWLYQPYGNEERGLVMGGIYIYIKHMVCIYIYQYWHDINHIGILDIK